MNRLSKFVSCVNYCIADQKKQIRNDYALLKWQLDELWIFGYVNNILHVNSHYKCKYAFLALTVLVPINANDPDTPSDEEVILGACWGTICNFPRPDFVICKKKWNYLFEIWQGYQTIKKYRCDPSIPFDYKTFNDRYQVSIVNYAERLITFKKKFPFLNLLFHVMLLACYFFRFQEWLVRSQWLYCAKRGLMRICNPQKHNHDVQQADCFYFDLGEQDESHLLFEMDASALSGLLGDREQAANRILDAHSSKAGKVIENILATRQKLPRSCNMSSTPNSAKALSTGAGSDDEVSDNDADVDSSFSTGRGGKLTGSGRRGRGAGRANRQPKSVKDGGNTNYANLYMQDYSGGNDQFSDHEDAITELAPQSQNGGVSQQPTSPKTAELETFRRMLEELQARNRQLEEAQRTRDDAGKDASIMQVVC